MHSSFPSGLQCLRPHPQPASSTFPPLGLDALIQCTISGQGTMYALAAALQVCQKQLNLKRFLFFFLNNVHIS